VSFEEAFPDSSRQFMATWPPIRTLQFPCTSPEPRLHFQGHSRSPLFHSHGPLLYPFLAWIELAFGELLHPNTMFPLRGSISNFLLTPKCGPTFFLVETKKSFFWA